MRPLTFLLLVFLFLSGIVKGDSPRYYTIVVNFHNIVDSSGSGFVTDQQLKDQLTVINDAFRPAKIQFTLGTIDHTMNDCWAHLKDGDTGDALEMNEYFLNKPENNPKYYLNIFTTDFTDNWEGFSSFPWEAVDYPQGDRIIIHYATVPGVSWFFKGHTAVHEIGHWLGLYHTFEGGCNPPGDHVDDTPYEAFPSEGCSPDRDTCPTQPGVDPTDNYMDYSPDNCTKRFTPGQIDRMRLMLSTFRTRVS